MALVKAAVESANDAILITEAAMELPGPRIEYVNAAFTRMTGYGIEEIVGQTPRVLPGPRTDPALTPLRDAGGKLSKWVAIQRDVTDRVRAQDERERVFRAEHAARLEGERVSRLKDEFLATLSHELRTPLTAILGWTGVLGASEASHDPEVTRGLEVIGRSARAQMQLVDDLLDMNRIVSGKVQLEFELLSLAQVIAEAVESVRQSANAKGIVIAEATDPLAAPVHGDRARLRQVFTNLLSNAIKFTPEDGRIEVLQNQSARPGGNAEVIVRDSGQGIAPEFLPFVFDRFRQMDSSASRRHGGLGLGLSIVKQLVELHGGTVRAESKGLEQGATFAVTFPIGKAVQAARFAPAVANSGARFSPAPAKNEETDLTSVHGAKERGKELAGIRLLLVEDEADQRYLLQKILQSRGAQVSVAENAKTGFERLRQERPQLLISDIGLPEMDGYEFLRRVRELPEDQGGQTPAIALTAFVRTEDRGRALEAGFLTHVTKPADTAELVHAVMNVARLAR